MRRVWQSVFVVASTRVRTVTPRPPGLVRASIAPEEDNREERDVAGKKRPKMLTQTEKKLPAKPKRPRKTSRGK
jgi:hypothetical protein